MLRALKRQLRRRRQQPAPEVSEASPASFRTDADAADTGTPALKLSDNGGGGGGGAGHNSGGGAGFAQCRLLNISVCAASVAASRKGEGFSLALYNPLAWRRSHPVRIPVAGEHAWSVSGAGGHMPHLLSPALTQVCSTTFCAHGTVVGKVPLGLLSIMAASCTCSPRPLPLQACIPELPQASYADGNLRMSPGSKICLLIRLKSRPADSSGTHLESQRLPMSASRAVEIRIPKTAPRSRFSSTDWLPMFPSRQQRHAYSGAAAAGVRVHCAAAGGRGAAGRRQRGGRRQCGAGVRRRPAAAGVRAFNNSSYHFTVRFLPATTRDRGRAPTYGENAGPEELAFAAELPPLGRVS